MADPIWQISLQMEIAKENINNNAKFHKCNKEIKQASPKFLGTWNSYCAQLWTQKELPMTLWRSWQESCSSGTNSLLRALLFFFNSLRNRSEFVFINPNSKGQCGCGESFTTWLPYQIFCLTFISGVQKWDHLKADDSNTHQKEVGIRNASHCRLSSAQFTWGGKLNLVSRHWHEKRGKKQFCANRHSDLSSNIGLLGQRIIRCLFLLQIGLCYLCLLFFIHVQQHVT
jgi:hypothetical protein